LASMGNTIAMTKPSPSQTTAKQSSIPKDIRQQYASSVQVGVQLVLPGIEENGQKEAKTAIPGEFTEFSPSDTKLYKLSTTPGEFTIVSSEVDNHFTTTTNPAKISSNSADELQQTPLSVQQIIHAIQDKKRDTDRVYTGTHCEPYRALFEKYDWDVEIAMAIFDGESRCVPSAKSPTNDHGLGQYHNGLAVYGEKIYDAEFNMEKCYYDKYKQGGFRHWAVYNSGDYLKYLK